MEKPDFEKTIGKLWEEANRFPMGAKAITRQIWNDYVEPLQKRLEEADAKNRELQWEILKLSKLDEPIRGEEISALEKDRDEFAIGKEMKWISVKDKLPPLYKKVLVYLSTGAIKVDERFKSLHGKQVGDWRHTYPDYNLTHWMPLPEPPQERSPVIGTGIPEGGKDYE